MKIKAVIDFTFTADPTLTREEMLNEIIDRIKTGEYLPEDVTRLELIPA